ncbi:MAG: LON peptidase substrate-binding domain-containing protein [Actinomycetota bacterium]|nr:LON peptidase substrate-binding domain-containing protein [Actinomycetota bacterium]
MAARIPLFPLGTVLMPGAALPLHIFEPRYRQLTVDLITGEVPEKEFGVVAVREGHSADTDGLDGMYPVGCTAALLDARRLPDGRYDVVTRGSRRFRLLDMDTEEKPYLTGSVDFLPDVTDPDHDDRLVAMLEAAARDAHRRYCSAAWRSRDWNEPDEDVPPGELAHLLAADCLLPLAERQELLELTSPLDRLREIRALLVRETALLTRLHAVPAPLGAFSGDHSPN